MTSKQQRIWAALGAITAVSIVGCGGNNGSSFQSDGSGGYGSQGMGANPYGSSTTQGGPASNTVTFYGQEGQTLLYREGDGEWSKLDSRASSTYPGVSQEATATIRDGKGRYSFAAIDEKRVQILETTTQETPIASFANLDSEGKVVKVSGTVSGFDPKEERVQVFSNTGVQNATAKNWTVGEGSDLVIQTEPVKSSAGGLTGAKSTKGLRLGPFKSSNETAEVKADLSSATAFEFVPYTLTGVKDARVAWENQNGVIDVLSSSVKGTDVVYLAPPEAQVKKEDYFAFYAGRDFKLASGTPGKTEVGWTASKATSTTPPKFPQDANVLNASVEKQDTGQYRFNFTPSKCYNVFVLTSAEVPGDHPRTFTFEITKGRIADKRGNFAYVTPNLSRMPLDEKVDIKSAPVDFEFTATGTGFPHPFDGVALLAKNKGLRASVKAAPEIPGFDKGTWLITTSTHVRAGS